MMDSESLADRIARMFREAPVIFNLRVRAELYLEDIGNPAGYTIEQIHEEGFVIRRPDGSYLVDSVDTGLTE